VLIYCEYAELLTTH